MNEIYISASEYQKVMNGKQKYGYCSCGLVDKKLLKKCDKDNKQMLKQIMKENKKKCKTCVNFNKKDFQNVSNYLNNMCKICLDCGRGFEWKNYKIKEDI